MAFVAHSPRGVDAVDVNTGKILWHSDQADRPLVIWKSRLAAFKKASATTMVIVVLDPGENGAAVSNSDPITLPEWCLITADNTADFATAAKLSNDTLLLQIVAKDTYRGGANPPSQILSKHLLQKSWIAEVNLDSGKVKLRDAEAELIDATVLSDSLLIGTKRLEILATRTDKTASDELVEKKLQASDAQTGQVIWQTSLGEVETTRRPKLPQ